jgi:hypothetical protein
LVGGVRWFAVLAAMIVSLSSATDPIGAEADESQTPSIAAYYNSVLATMNALPTPGSVVFQTVVTASGIGVRLQEDDGQAKLFVGLGGGYRARASWETHYDDPSHMTIAGDGIANLRAFEPVFDPTWNGAFEMMKYGFDGNPAAGASPRPIALDASPSPFPSSTDSTSSPTSVIGHIRAIGTAFYRVEDAGSTVCPSGSVGRHLKLTPWRGPQDHPLTDVVVDAPSNRICRMRFNLGNKSTLSLTGTYETRFADFDGYWLVSGSDATLLYRVFGIGAKHAKLHFTYEHATS